LSANPPLRSANVFIPLLSKGTKPLEPFSANQIKYIKENLIRTVDQTKKDYYSGLFKSYQSYPTSTGIILNSVEDALQFNAFHEGIHLGVILSLIKLV
jgi:hypothetical protein